MILSKFIQSTDLLFKKYIFNLTANCTIDYVTVEQE
jgi:hypothetical protein